MTARPMRLLLAAGLLAVSTMVARAEEVITRFHADIKVAASGEMDVTETIAVVSEGIDIRHGIFRDFPLTFRDRDGRIAHVDFTLEEVKRDGEAEPYHTEDIPGGIRIYAGSAETEVARGAHVYEIRYRTDRQIRYFDDHDELYWNVTGNGWLFPIRAATAHVEMPDAIPAGGVAFYTGPEGSTAQDARILKLDGATVDIATTGPLGAREGLSIVIAQKKGAIAAPTSARTGYWFLRDNLGAIIGWTGFAALFAYYFSSWARVGRDPPAGVMVPRWDPPGGLSPALINYVDNKGFSGQGWTAFSATALQLAVKGYVTLEDLDKAVTFRRTDKPLAGTLPKGEDVLLAAIEKAGGTYTVNKANGTSVQSLGNRFRSAIEGEHRNKYYIHNSGYVTGGVIASILILIGSFWFAHVSEDVVGLGFAMVFAATVGGGMISAFGRALTGGHSLFRKLLAVVAMGFVAFVGLIILSVIILAGMETVDGVGGMALISAAGAIVLLNILFFFLMGAPTPLGRQLMDGIEGFRTYMTLAEKDRMNLMGAPTMSPSHYETLLPYAVALGVEKPWSQNFERWLVTAAAAGAASAAYQPAWYSGHGFSSGRLTDFSSSMASTIASTLPQPKSSSSSGFSSGGFSGGGGGGGGGGGW
ncbi:DUF2207 domain-containing protein [Gellertiella hungarica]|uniref:Putative membrane protein YgcG n=1 Tax=Gellertiella hungarica TaxID=1572859 RepID=A0A7W6J5G8_9HYPH|nr:DUF2207 domain-containing protein [Gellertiella hungarica]MBB4064367.1 putative membrane protein YgcG [Gellertiella hungarica]